MQDCLFAISGQGAAGGLLGSVEVYDGHRDAWLPLAAKLPQPRVGLQGAFHCVCLPLRLPLRPFLTQWSEEGAAQGRLVVTGGLTERGRVTRTVAALDPREGSWSNLKTMTSSRVWHGLLEVPRGSRFHPPRSHSSVEGGVSIAGPGRPGADDGGGLRGAGGQVAPTPQTPLRQ